MNAHDTFQGFKATLHAVLLFIFSSALSKSLIEKTSVTYGIVEQNYDLLPHNYVGRAYHPFHSDLTAI
jgi:hypothetical protein